MFIKFSDDAVLEFSSGVLSLADDRPKISVLFDFGSVAPVGNANLINNTDVGQKIADAIDTAGAQTGIALSLAEEFDGQSDNTVDFPNGNPWGAENNVLRDCFFTNGVGNASIVLSGLIDSTVYTIELASYRTGSGDQYTDFTINGTTQTVFTKGDTSVGGVVSFDVSPVSGSITIDVNESGGYTVGYLNAMRLSWAASTIPTDSRYNIQAVAAYLRDTGNYTSTQTNAIIYEWLSSEGYATQINTAWYNYLEALGYTGTLTDKLRKWRDE